MIFAYYKYKTHLISPRSWLSLDRYYLGYKVSTHLSILALSWDGRRRQSDPNREAMFWTTVFTGSIFSTIHTSPPTAVKTCDIKEAKAWCQWARKQAQLSKSRLHEQGSITGRVAYTRGRAKILL
jgi:hypothetical protein